MDSDPVCKIEKKLQWKWWLITICITLLSAGFYASQYLTGSYLQRTIYDLDKKEHLKLHLRLDKKYFEFEKLLTEIRIEQATTNEKLEILLKHRLGKKYMKGDYDVVNDFVNDSLEKIIKNRGKTKSFKQNDNIKTDSNVVVTSIQ
jgi:hypothetical protein